MREQSVQDARGGARTTRYGRLSFWASVLGVCSLSSDRSSTTRLLRINQSECSAFFQLVHAPLGGWIALERVCKRAWVSNWKQSTWAGRTMVKEVRVRERQQRHLDLYV